MSSVRDIVHDREFFHAAETDTVAEVARKMADLQVGAILVLNGEVLRGVFSERDLMKRVVLERLDPEQTPVSAVMTTTVVTIDELAPIEEAMAAMHANKCRHLPVMRSNLVVGFLSMRDLMHYELERKTEELHHMHAYVSRSA
jgi:signal-transduction protein with cAMP-binding, CBS, and nucleotidyltransferase domain